MITNLRYPLEPIQMTLVSGLTIGFPSFVLSFLKNTKRIKTNIVHSIVRNSLPAALTSVITVLCIVSLAVVLNITDEQVSGLCVISLAITGITLTIKIYKPITKIKLFVTVVQIGGLVSVLVLWADFFNVAFFVEIPFLYIATAVIVLILNIAIINWFSEMIDHIK